MTPFGARVRILRDERGLSQKDMAKALGVSAAYLSALEHGQRSRPSFDFVQRVISYFNIIWDDADELITLAGLSHPRVVIDTSNLSSEATAFANELSRNIKELDHEAIAEFRTLLQQKRKR